MDTSKIVGEKIKSLRESQSISMEELAQRSGLAIEQIERIENNIDLPSLAPLIKIARVLGVRLGTFLDDQDENGPVVCRKDESQNSISFSNNAIHSRKHMEYHSLSKSKADRHMEPFIIDVAATDDSDFVLSSHEGEEFIMVMEGTMEISYGKNTYLLEEGDSIYYDSIVPHHVHAYEGQAAKILAVVYTPISINGKVKMENDKYFLFSPFHFQLPHHVIRTHPRPMVGTLGRNNTRQRIYRLL